MCVSICVCVAFVCATETQIPTGKKGKSGGMSL